MKTILLFLVSVALSAQFAFAEGKVDLKPGDNVRGVLERFSGAQVEVRLRSGDKLAGKLVTVGENAIHLSSLAGMEFYDAVVSIEDISAVIVRAK